MVFIKERKIFKGLPLIRKNEKITKDNFFIATEANWTFVKGVNGEEILQLRKQADFISDYNSSYFYDSVGVSRMSDHFPKKLASCSWTLDGKEYVKDFLSKNERFIMAIGYCKWKDFKKITVKRLGFEGIIYNASFYPYDGKYDDFSKAWEKEYGFKYNWE